MTWRRTVLWSSTVNFKSANAKQLLLALFLCLGMIALSGPGGGITCAERAQLSCGCCPMQAEEVCCSAPEEPIPVQPPALPDARGAQQLLQAIIFTRPLLVVLPAAVPADFPSQSFAPALSSAGPSVQVLLCVRTV